MTIDELNFLLECLAEEERQERIDLQYEELVELPYYLLECEQFEEDARMFNEFG